MGFSHKDIISVFQPIVNPNKSACRNLQQAFSSYPCSLKIHRSHSTAISPQSRVFPA